MKNKLPTVALIFGGRGYEHGVSVKGASFLYSQIDGESYRKLPVYITREGSWLAPTEEITNLGELVNKACKYTEVAPAYIQGKGGLLSPSAFTPIYAAIPLLHGDYGEDGVVQGALENAKIPYVGCDVLGGAVTSDKAYTKLAAEHLGIKTVPWILEKDKTAEEARLAARVRLSYPLFIKPARLGSSVGAAAVNSESEFDSCYSTAARLGQGRVLIEEKISVAKELECAFFASKSEDIFTFPGEIELESSYYDYDSKYADASAAKVRARASVDSGVVDTVREWAKELVGFLGIRDLARIDFFLSRDGQLYFNEINTFPGFTESSLYPRMLALSGISAGSLADGLIACAFARRQ